MRKVFLDGLPRCRFGKSQPCGVIDWKNSIGYKINFIYDDIEGELEVVDYHKEIVYVKYLNYDVNKIRLAELKSAKIGKVIKKITNEFKVNVGEIFKDEKRDLVITGKYRKKDKYGREWKNYEYTCNKCGWTEGSISENKLRSGQGCACCCNPARVVVQDINSMWKTNYWMVELGVDEEWAKTHTSQSNEKAPCKCPHCGDSCFKKATKIYRDKSISCKCNTGTYPEKFICNILKQLGLSFKMQYSPEYLNNKRSDFYIGSLKLVIEADGGLGHVGGKVHGKTNKTLEELVEIDKWKDEQHRLHGVRTIRINCFESDAKYIKDNVLNSEVVELLDLSKIDWDKANLHAIKSNKIKEVCEYWNNKEEWETTITLSSKIGINTGVITNYLKKGAKLGWCEYDPKEEMRNNGRRKGRELGYNINVSKDDIFIYSFNSISELYRKSEEFFGFKMHSSIVSSILNPNSDKYNNLYNGFRITKSS